MVAPGALKNEHGGAGLARAHRGSEPGARSRTIQLVAGSYLSSNMPHARDPFTMNGTRCVEVEVGHCVVECRLLDLPSTHFMALM